MSRLRQDLRNQIVALLQAGTSQRECASLCYVHQSTISRLYQRFVATGSCADRPGPGQPRVTTRRQDNFIRQRHVGDRFTTEYLQQVRYKGVAVEIFMLGQ